VIAKDARGNVAQDDDPSHHLVNPLVFEEFGYVGQTGIGLTHQVITILFVARKAGWAVVCDDGEA
jgi:hypothetical protein